MLGWFNRNNQWALIKRDRKLLEARAWRRLQGYLSADAPRKQRYYGVIAGAAAACQPSVSDPNLENAQLAQAAVEAALKVVKLREHQRIVDNDQVGALITGAYATVAIAYRRASAAYTVDKKMQQLGTAAVHLVTIAISYMDAQADEVAQNDRPFTHKRQPASSGLERSANWQFSNQIGPKANEEANAPCEQPRPRNIQRADIAPTEGMH